MCTPNRNLLSPHERVPRHTHKEGEERRRKIRRKKNKDVRKEVHAGLTTRCSWSHPILASNTLAKPLKSHPIPASNTLQQQTLKIAGRTSALSLFRSRWRCCGCISLLSLSSSSSAPQTYDNRPSYSPFLLHSLSHHPREETHCRHMQ